MDRHELAWAAGFFDGEGWANRTGRGVQARINQAGVEGLPEVLIKFQRIVRVGRLKGPDLREGKKPLYRWEATARADVTKIAESIGCWLCPNKRRALERTLSRPIRPYWPGQMSEELAWAGGLFDGEGSTYLEKHRTHANYFVPRLHVTQSAVIGIAPELIRLKSALGDLGTISGIRPGKGNQRPYRRWRAFTSTDVQLGLHLLWPWIGDVKRCQAREVLIVVTSQERLARGNPMFGVAGARYCLRGHDKAAARIRPYLPRGTGNNPNRHLRQCLACVRERVQK